MENPNVLISKHAADRFQSRVRPTLDVASASAELSRLASLGEIVAEPPLWFAERQRQETPRYLVVGDLVMPLRPIGTSVGAGRWCAVTCIARGGISEKARHARNRRRRSTHRRAQARRSHA